MTTRFSILVMLCICCIILLAGYLAGVSYPDLMPETFSFQTTPVAPSHRQPSVTINLPTVVTPVDDGHRYYYVQMSLAVDLDRSVTAGLIQARHQVIDRKIMELLNTYQVTELRSPGLWSTLRTDIQRMINQLLPEGYVRNVYITNLLMTPATP